MPDWDEDSPQLRENLTQLLEDIAQAADQRKLPTVEAARLWQSKTMQGLPVLNAEFVGAFRGEPGLKNVQARIRATFGIAAMNVAAELVRFERKLQRIVADLDARLTIGSEPNADQLAAVLDLCAWAHAEWIRIHPFANGNGRTARLWANSLAMRYGLPPFIRLRPRPSAGYGEAGANAMLGDWKPMAQVFRRLLDSFLNGT
jgi:Uncharacterized conserved protein